MKEQRLYTSINEFKQSLVKWKTIQENSEFSNSELERKLLDVPYKTIDGKKVIHIDDMPVDVDDDNWEEIQEELENIAMSKGFIINTGMADGGRTVYMADDEVVIDFAEWLNNVGGTV